MGNIWRRFRGLKLWQQVTIASVLLVILIVAVTPAAEDEPESGDTSAVAAATEEASANPTEQAAQQDSTPAPTAEATPEPTPEATPAPTEEAGFADGTWLVGADVEPGRYRATDLQSCYWERLSGLSGAFGDIISNGNESGASAVVDLAPEDRAFQTSRCGRWLPLDDPATADATAPFSDGVWVVGLDIEPGTWRSTGGGSCYWERLAHFDGSFDGILANANTEGSAIVEILPTDVGFRATRCGEWSKVE